MKKIVITIAICTTALSAVAQTGGGYNLEQNVIGNGGWRSDGSGFTVLGTMGQSNAGSTASGGFFHLIDGLWAIENPTANSPFARVSGSIALSNGAGIPRVLVTITNATTNVSLRTRTHASGFYEFPQVVTGANYVLTVSHIHFQFQPSATSIFVSQDRLNVNFVASP